MINLARYASTMLLAVALALCGAGNSYAGKLSHAAWDSYKLYKGTKRAVGVTKGAIKVARYARKLEKISHTALDPRQTSLLKKCFKSKNCVDWIKNPRKWDSRTKDRLIGEWERETGRIWPRQANGERFQAHHIIPKQHGGPHEWWNMHPVPMDQHQPVIHAARGVLNELVGFYRP